MKFNSLIILLFFSLVGCEKEKQVQQLFGTERQLPILYENHKDGNIITFYIDVNRYIMLDYDFYVEVVNNSTFFAMVFCEFNDINYHYYTEDAIVLDLSDSLDSIYYNFKINLLKLRSYIQNSTYFNQEYKLKNKLNTLQYIVKQMIYILENNKKYRITYADCKRMREIKIINTEIKSDTINWIFCSGNTKNYYSLSLITKNESIIDLLIR